jgi:hypothetical protein
MNSRDTFKEFVTLPSHTPYKKRLKHALLVTGHEPSWERIESCCKERRCQSYYCDSCRAGACKNQATDVIKLHRELHGEDDAFARQNIQSVTVLHDLVAPGHKNGGRYNDFSGVERSISSLRRKLSRVRKTFSRLLIFGRIELEIVNTRSIINSGQCARKASVIKHIMGDKLYGQNDLVLIHTHFLMFLNGNNLDDVKSCLARRWPGKYMTEVKSTFRDKTVEYNISKLCGYYAKNRYVYNHSMESVGYKTGKLLCDDVLSYLVRLLLHLGYTGLVLWSRR